MTEATAPAPPAVGSFCWHELMTKDQAGAVDFYTKIFGWTTHDMPMGDTDTYKVLMDGELPFGGIFSAVGPQFEQVPPHWAGYISVDDVDASAARAEELGGKIYAPPADIPEIGRFAIVADPTGATFALFKGNESSPTAQAIVWNELMTTDQAACVTFYTSLFGWTTDDMDMGDCGLYKIFKNDDTGIGGCMTIPPAAEGMPSCWVTYIGVSNVDETVTKAESLGAKVCQPATDIPNVGRFAVVTDPTGASVAFFQGNE